MPVLNFNQRVILGFGVILLLLAVSGVSSLWNLYGIDRSNTRVNDIAVPMVQQGNAVQIELLKLANLSALGFNAQQQEAFQPYETQFSNTVPQFNQRYDRLQLLSQQDAAMQSSVASIRTHYEAYTAAVQEMFAAKQAAIRARQRTDESANALIGKVDDVASAMTNLIFYEPPSEYAEDMAVAAGSADQADAIFARMVPEIQKLQRGQDLEEAQERFLGIETNVMNAMEFFEHAAGIMGPFDDDNLVPAVREAVAALSAELARERNILYFKEQQLAERDKAVTWFDTSNEAVNQAVTGLDALLATVDEQFGRLQGELSSSLDFGLKSTVIILLILFVLATQNFISMRRAIQRKMDDLAKLNGIGSALAAARSQDSALQEVLQALSVKIGIEQGSVYLFNKAKQLEAKAFLPPRAIPEDSKALPFTLGEGVIGHAAEAKQTIFVPDTSKDKTYVRTNEQEKPRALLCVPLLDKDLLIGVMNFSGDINAVNFADSDYEFVSSAATSLVTTIKNIRMVEVIEEHNRTLEKKVEERTAALKQKNDDIANMLQNMNQGLFTITQGGIIHPEYAAYLETIFDTRHIAQRHFVDLLFQYSTTSQDMIDQVATSVESIVGEDSMMYEFNEHLLAREFTLTLPEQPQKLLELDWNPIIDDTETVIKLMVTVRDVTALKALQAEADAQRQELLIIGEVLAIDAEKCQAFFQGSERFIARCRELISQTRDKNADVLAELFRNMHTVKGNARTYGFKQITETVHLVENSYDQLRKEAEAVWQPEQLLSELDDAERVIQRYADVFHHKLGRGADSEVIRLPRATAETLLDDLQQLQSTPLSPPVYHLAQRTYQALISTEALPIQQVISGVLTSVQSLAGELGKPVPNMQIDDGGLLIRHDAHSMLNNVFMHVFRNAMDHGIEQPADREAAGKPAQGNITLQAELVGDMARFKVSDDGRGIALTRIFKKAQESGLYAADAPRPPASEIANLIFASGFSTAEQVTEVSGRGVGMDAVKSFLQSEGGSIAVELADGDETADFRNFITVLNLPVRFIVQAPRFALAS